MPQGCQGNLIQEIKQHSRCKHAPVNLHVQIFVGIKVVVEISSKENRYQNQENIFDPFHEFFLFAVFWFICIFQQLFFGKLFVF